MPSSYDQPLGCIDQETARHLLLTKSYPQRQFNCDSCGSHYQSATFYTLAYHESELPYARVYCENCLKQLPTGSQRLKQEKNTMPKINKPQKTQTKKSTKKAKKTVSRALTKTKPAKNPAAYFECMSACCQKGIKPKKITQVAQECKHNALTINAKMSAVKAKAAQKIKTGYETMGKGLAELIEASK
jgi:hypothetical protein